MRLKSFILSMLAGDDGLGISSKRVVSFIAFIVIVIVAFVDLFSSLTISEFIFDGIMYIVIAGFFFNAIEAFSKRTGKSSHTNINIEEVKSVAVDAMNSASVSTTTTQKTAPIAQQIAEANRELKENEIIG